MIIGHNEDDVGPGRDFRTTKARSGLKQRHDNKTNKGAYHFLLR
jgi:hypothetical protein